MVKISLNQILRSLGIYFIIEDIGKNNKNVKKTRYSEENGGQRKEKNNFPWLFFVQLPKELVMYHSVFYELQTQSLS